MTDLAEMIEDIFWRVYHEKECDETQLEYLSESHDRLPDEECYVPLKMNKAFLRVPGKKEDSPLCILYFNAWEDRTNNEDRIVYFPYIIRGDLEKLPEQEYKKFVKINETTKARRTFNGGLELIAYDKNRPSRVVRLEEAEVRIMKACL
jgi:hypothetical protein